MEKFKKISDINCVAYLLSKGFLEATLPKLEEEHVFFYFKDTPELQKEVDTFFCGQPMVNAQPFGLHLRRLRITVAELRRQGGVR